MGKRGATAVPSETFSMWRDVAPRRLFRAYLPFYPERRRWPPEVAFRRLLRGALPSLCQWAPRGRNAPQGIQAAPPERTATLATARRHRSLPTQSPSRPVFPWEELPTSLRGFSRRGLTSARTGAEKPHKELKRRGDIFSGGADRGGFIPACRAPAGRGRSRGGRTDGGEGVESCQSAYRGGVGKAAVQVAAAI